MSDEVLIFQHVPKCGGTAFREACARMFPVEHELFGDEQPPPVPSLAPGLGLRMVTGHYIHDGLRPRERFGAALDAPHVRLITVVRDPLSRAISAYNFRRQRNRKSPPEIRRWLENRANPMARFLGCGEDVGAWLAKMDFVGVNEALQDSVDLLAAMLGLTPASVETVNVTKKRSEEAVSGETREIFRQNNSLDYALYKAALERFQNECRDRLGRTLEMARSFSQPVS